MISSSVSIVISFESRGNPMEKQWFPLRFLSIIKEIQWKRKGAHCDSLQKSRGSNETQGVLLRIPSKIKGIQREHKGSPLHFIKKAMAPNGKHMGPLSNTGLYGWMCARDVCRAHCKQSHQKYVNRDVHQKYYHHSENIIVRLRRVRQCHAN